MNAFSTVANACELNKRVLYARDAGGRVVGRKLVAISTQGKLIGFHNYASLPTQDGNRELRAIFTDYCTRFAQDCGLQMADEGEVDRLFTEDWYDDGAVSWTEDDRAPQRSGRTVSGAPSGVPGATATG